MGAITIPSFGDKHLDDTFRSIFVSPTARSAEEHGRLTDIANSQDADFPTSDPTTISDSEIEQFIAQLAESGVYDDDLGMPKRPPSVFQAIAQQWVLDKEAVGEMIGPAFWKWARSAALLGKFGK